MTEVQEEAEVHPKEVDSRAETDLQGVAVGVVLDEAALEVVAVLVTAFPVAIASDHTELTRKQLHSIHITFKYFTSEVSPYLRIFDSQRK